MDDGRMMFIVRTSGIPFEAVSKRTLQNNYDSLNSLMLSLGKAAGSRLAAWCFLDRFETEFQVSHKFGYDWLQNMASGYMAQFRPKEGGRRILENQFYIAFLLKPGLTDSLDDCIKEAHELQATVSKSLAAYDCEILQHYEEGGILFSEVYEFLGYLYNGVWAKTPVTAQPARAAIPEAYLRMGYKLLETHLPGGGRRYSTLFDLKDFPATTKHGQLNAVLKLPFPFLLCFSFTFLVAGEALEMLQSSLNKLESAGDAAEEQHEEIAKAPGAVMAGEVVFGELHGALVVHGATPKEAEDRGGQARVVLTTNGGATFVQSNLSAPETFFSLFPGNLKRRPRPMPKTTRNLTGVFGMNNYSSGKRKGNPIGDGSAVMPLKSASDGVYHFNFHYTLPEADALGEKVAGHTVIHGATGTGKTTLQSVLVSFLDRWQFKLFGIDKDGSMRGMIEALGGTYFQIRMGEPTGLNPFQLPDEPANRHFLYGVVEACGRRGDKELTAEDMQDIKNGVDTVFQLPIEHRRFSAVLQSIPDRGEDCLARRLAEWCHGKTAGRFAWALDNPRNLFDWEQFSRVGFDVTDFLKDGNPVTEPILACLFHGKRMMQKRGGLLATVVEEYWVPIKYKTTAAEILDTLKTGRRRFEFIILVSQNPDEAIKSPLLPDILGGCATKIFLANPEAEYKTPDGGGYHRFKLTEEEFAELSKIGRHDRVFLVKQGGQSSFVTLDMSNVLEYISVLAMDASEFPLLEQAKAIAGQHPDAWVPKYIQLRREARAKVTQ